MKNQFRLFLHNVSSAPAKTGAGLIEAVAAIAVIGIGLITLLSMFAPFAKGQKTMES